MTRAGWSDAAHRYLDGEGPPPGDVGERARADGLQAALAAYAAGLTGPGAELDHAVLAAVRARRAVRRVWWRWLVEPQRVAVRPALAAAAVVVLVAIAAVAVVSVRPPSPTAAAVEERGTAGTVLVRFELRAPDAHQVALAGSFNGWSDSTIVFSHGTEPGLWTVTVALRPGEYQYLFVVDGERWIPDPSAHALVKDEFGQRNSLLVVGPRGVVRS